MMHMMMQQMHHHSVMSQACLMGTCPPVLPGVYMQPMAHPQMGYEGAEQSLLRGPPGLEPHPPEKPPSLAHRKPAGLKLSPAPARPTIQHEDGDDDDKPSPAASFQCNNDGDDDPNGEVISIGEPNSPDNPDAEGTAVRTSAYSKGNLRLVSSSWHSGKAAPPPERLTFQLFTVGYSVCGARWKRNFHDMCTVGIHCIANRIATSHKSAKNIDLWIDCQWFKNPDRDPQLTNHIGENLSIIEEFTQNSEFVDRVVCELGMLGLRFV